MPRTHRSRSCATIGCFSAWGYRKLAVGGQKGAPLDPRAARRLGPILVALGGLMAAGPGCDMLWKPYEVALEPPLPDLSVAPIPPDGSTPDQAASTPTTCAEAQAGKTPADGPYTLFIGGDGKKPWTAECKVQSGGKLLEYLAVDPAQNYSQYTAGGSAMGSDVRTRYRLLRLDPVTLRVSCGDQTYAESNGNTVNHPNMPAPIPVTSMPYAVAMGCMKSAPNGVGNIDLGTTPFRVVANSIMLSGITPVGDAKHDPVKHTVSLTGGGFCGYQTPTPDALNPINKNTGVYLQLEYAPLQ